MPLFVISKGCYSHAARPRALPSPAQLQDVGSERDDSSPQGFSSQPPVSPPVPQLSDVLPSSCVRSLGRVFAGANLSEERQRQEEPSGSLRESPSRCAAAWWKSNPTLAEQSSAEDGGRVGRGGQGCLAEGADLCFACAHDEPREQQHSYLR